ncbi:MAG: hypothetical protein COA43_07595 [Robiginitomaculum sp.]|nr:MAG: hypothetical protein COA43_07595 [Robiginitomaculum sp.]
MAIGDFFKSFAKDVQGSFAMLMAGSVCAILMATGVAVDYSRVSKAQSQAQDQVDTAVLAAAIYLKHAREDGYSDESKLEHARTVALENLATWIHDGSISFALSDVIIKDGQITVSATGNVVPVMLGMFGVKGMALDASASVSLAAGNTKPVDVDVVLISDITGSMGGTLESVQKNMKRFSDDLTSKLLTENIRPSRIRVQVIFYKDYFVDSNPMNISVFYELPYNRGGLDRYVDGFVASGGGDFAESGLEAVWYGVNAPWDARSGSILTRAIILWTDAAALDFKGAPNVTDLAMNLDKSGTSTVKYPAKMPSNLVDLGKEFASFHKVNSNNQPGVVSMSVNITTGVDMVYYPNWDLMQDWNGVHLYNSSLSGSEAYDMILDQVVLSVLTQATARDIAITQ